MLQRKLSTLLAIVGLIGPTAAFGATQANLTISALGSQLNNGYVSFVQVLSTPCSFNNVYVDLLTEGGKARYAVLLSAKAARLPIVRIDYTKDVSGTCWLELVEI